MGKSKELAELGQVVSQSNGNVGIGTDIPEQSLHIKGSNYNEQLVIERADTSSKWGVAGAGNGAFQVYDINAGNATRMTIDASGRVTMPYQPAFHATIANPFTGNGSVAGSETITFDSASVNVGGHYDTSTGRFTAPVAGVYHFSYTVSPGTSSISARYLRVQLLKNGATYLNPHNTISNESGDADYNIVSASGNVYLNANDYVHIVFGSSTATNTLAFYTQMTFFSGYLIG